MITEQPDIKAIKMSYDTNHVTWNHHKIILLVNENFETAEMHLYSFDACRIPEM